MNKTVYWLSAILLAAIVTHARADQAFDPTARAELIAPLVEEETVGVAHVDLSRADLGAVMPYLVEMSRPTFDLMGKVDKSKVKKVIDELKQTGIRDVFVIFSIAGFRGCDMPFFVASLPQGTDLSKVQKLANTKYSEHIINASGDYFVIAYPETIKRLKQITPDARPELQKAFEAAGDTDYQILLLPPKHTVRTVSETMPELPKQFGGGPSSVLTRGCLWAAVGVKLSPTPAARGVVQSVDHNAAEALATYCKPFVEMLNRQSFVKNKMPYHSRPCDVLVPTVKGSRLVWIFNKDNGGIFQVTNLARQWITERNEHARRAVAINQLKQIGLAIWNWESSHGTLPTEANYDKDGKPLLSWRVHILPYLDQGKLYRRFHLDEPWDSPHNKKLIEEIPQIYQNPRSKAPTGKTTYLVPVGPGTLFEGHIPRKPKDIKDGTSQTIMVVEIDDTHAVTWTKPDDWHFNPTKPMAGLDDPKRNSFLALFVDGSVHTLSPNISPDIISKLITIAGGEVVSPKEY